MRLARVGDVVCYWVWTGGEAHSPQYARVVHATRVFLTVITEHGERARKRRDFFARVVTDPAEYADVTFNVED